MGEFEEIYAEYYTMVYKYILSRCANPSLAEEIAQETFFRAFRSIGSFRGDCRIGSWLCQIAGNLYLSHARKMKNRDKNVPDGAIPDMMNIETQFLDREDAARIHRALHNLSEPYKEVFWLKTFGELGFKQIGELFNRSENWARVTYYRAKMKIREELE